MTTLAELIEQNSAGPKSVQVGNQKVEQHSIADQIAADQHLAAKQAASSPTLGLRFVQLIPTGAW